MVFFDDVPLRAGHHCSQTQSRPCEFDSSRCDYSGCPRPGRAVGFAKLFSDGEMQAYLATMAGDESRRGKGIGRALVNEALRLAGGERVDLLRADNALKPASNPG